MTYTPDQIITMLKSDPNPGPNTKRLIGVIERQKKEGMQRMSLGTWAPGHPKDIEEWATGILAFEDAINPPDDKIRDLYKRQMIKSGNDFLKIDSLSCHKSWLLQKLGYIKANHPETAKEIDEWVSEVFTKNHRPHLEERPGYEEDCVRWGYEMQLSKNNKNEVL